MSKPTKKELKEKAEERAWGRKFMLVVAGVFLVIAILFATISSGYLQLGFQWVVCGGKAPVIIDPGSSFASGYPASYVISDDPSYRPRFDSKYYCTEEQAQKAGYNISPFSEASRELKQQTKNE